MFITSCDDQGVYIVYLGHLPPTSPDMSETEVSSSVEAAHHNLLDLIVLDGRSRSLLLVLCFSP